MFAPRTAFALLALALLLGPGCGGGGGGGGENPEPVGFDIEDTRPIDGERFVSQDVVVSVEFSRNVDPGTVTGAMTLRTDMGVPVAGDLALTDGDRTLRFRPSARLAVATVYRVTLAAGIASADGDSLERDRTFSFTTVLQPTPQPPKPEDFRPTFGPLNVGRSQHTATLLEDGTVLLAGGFIDSSKTTAVAEVYDPEEFLFEIIGTAMINARARHTATRLDDGRVLIVGGLATGGNRALGTCEIYNPQNASFTSAGLLKHARAYHTADLLEDGRVLVCGGAYFDQNGAFRQLAVAEIYDPVTGDWAEVAETMVRDRSYHTSTRLDDGRILLVGGASDRAAEIFDPESSSFTRTAGDAREYRSGHVATKLPNGVVLLSGGGAMRGELYFPNENRFEHTSNGLSIDRTFATVSPTRDGGILILGGIYFGDTTTILLGSMDLYSQIQGGNGSYFIVGTLLAEPRAGHTATVLADGETTLFCGGINTDWTQPELRSAFLFRQD